MSFGKGNGPVRRFDNGEGTQTAAASTVTSGRYLEIKINDAHDARQDSNGHGFEIEGEGPADYLVIIDANRQAEASSRPHERTVSEVSGWGTLDAKLPATVHGQTGAASSAMVDGLPTFPFAGSVSPVGAGGSSVTTSALTATALTATAGRTATATNKAAGDPTVSRFVSNPAYDVSEAYAHEDMRDPGAIVAMPRSNHRDDGADDGGYMDVEAGVEGTSRHAGRLESDVSLITDTGLGRQGSDVPLLVLADPGIVRRRLSATSEL